MNDMNWSSRDPASKNSTRSSAAFGMYRDPSQPARQDDTFRNPNQSGSSGFSQGLQTSTSNGYPSGSTDTKFRLRAYEPSPLANPSMVTSLGGMSLGEMFGFPSATFQPPENLFAHRSARGPEERNPDMWSYRRTTNSGNNLNRTLNHRNRSTQSRFADSADLDMDDDQDDFGAASGLALGRIGLDASEDSGPFGSFGRASLSEPSRFNSLSNGQDAFGAQRFFPPEPETGLEDNFLGIVKIVDDYLPPQPGPRNIASRNLVFKKRLARGWFSLLFVCRSLLLWKVSNYGCGRMWLSKGV